MDSATLLALAERCEKATGPDQQIDSDIAAALGWVKHPNPTFAGGLIDMWSNPQGRMQRWNIPAYTASLDAALTLVPEGWAWMTGCDFDERFFANLAATDEAASAPPADVSGVATPALALCAAALRALNGGEGL